MEQNSFSQQSLQPSGMMIFLRVAKVQIYPRLKPSISRQVHRNSWWCHFSHFEKHWASPTSIFAICPHWRLLFQTPETSIPSLPAFLTPGNQKLVIRMLHSWGLFAWVDYLRHSLKGYIHGLCPTCQLTAPTKDFSSSLGSLLVDSLTPTTHTHTTHPSSLSSNLTFSIETPKLLWYLFFIIKNNKNSTS